MTQRTNRPHGGYSDDFACENCDAVGKGPYRRGLCCNCYARQRHRSKHGTKTTKVTEKIELSFHDTKAHPGGFKCVDCDSVEPHAKNRCASCYDKFNRKQRAKKCATSE